jgi:hypothetical protein
MAVIAKTIEKIDRDSNRSWHVYWETITNGDSGSPLEIPAHADRSVQILGTFGVGGTIIIEGSNDGSNYVTLNDFQGNALSFTAEGLESIAQIVNYIRPRVTVGDGSTDLDVHIVMTGAL